MLQLPNLYLNATENFKDFNAMLIFLILHVRINLGTFKCENRLKLMAFIVPLFNLHILEPKELKIPYYINTSYIVNSFLFIKFFNIR